MWARFLVLIFVFCFALFGLEYGTSESGLTFEGLALNLKNVVKQRYLLRNDKLRRIKRGGKSNKIKNKVLKFRRELGEKIKNFEKRGKNKKTKKGKKKKVRQNKKGKKKNKKGRKNLRKKNKRKHKNRKKKSRKNKKSRYYSENGKYRINKKFSKWAKDLKSQWKKVRTDSSCSCGISGAEGRKKKTEDRIVNGQEASVHKYPWIISMMDGSGYWYCGGSIISDQWILTAAHCVYDEPNAKDMYVRVGDHDNADEGDTKLAETFKVESFVYHKKYDPETTNNDIALLKLEKKIDFSKYGGTVSPVCLPEAPRKYYGKSVTVSGWGLLEDGGKQAHKLMEVDLEVIWMRECREGFKYNPSWITSRMMCTFAKGDDGEVQDACQGDSGGPLVRLNQTRGRYEQVGVVSWGIGCASPKYPGVFVKLSHFLLWVLKKTKKSTFCSG